REVDGVRTGGVDGGHGRAEVGVADLDGLGADDEVAERVDDAAAQARAVLGRVVDDEHALGADVLQVGRHRGRLGVVVADDAVEGVPAVGGQRRVGRRRRHGHQAGLREHLAGGRGLAGERRADDADDVVVAHDLAHQRGGLRRVALGVELLQGHLAVGVRLEELLEREGGAVDDVDAEVRGRAREGTDVGEDRRAVAAGVVAAPAVTVAGGVVAAAGGAAGRECDPRRREQGRGAPEGGGSRHSLSSTGGESGPEAPERFGVARNLTPSLSPRGRPAAALPTRNACPPPAGAGRHRARGLAGSTSVDMSAVERLLTPEGWTLLSRMPPYDEDASLQLATGLRERGVDPDLVAAVMTQSRLRTRARAKFGAFADEMLFTPEGLEQATRLPVAARHAQRYASAGARLVADLGCGIGSDAMAMAGLGLRVLGVEKDEV